MLTLGPSSWSSLPVRSEEKKPPYRCVVPPPLPPHPPTDSAGFQRRTSSARWLITSGRVTSRRGPAAPLFPYAMGSA